MLDLTPVAQPSVFSQPQMSSARLADLALQAGASPGGRRLLAQGSGGIQEPENWGRLELPVIGWVYVRLGELLYEWNDLADAWDHLRADWNAPNWAVTCGR